MKNNIRKRWWGPDAYRGACFCCGAELPYEWADVGHLRAAAKGGGWVPENCRLICRSCNALMRTQHMKAFMRMYFPERYNHAWPHRAASRPAAPRKRRARRPLVVDPLRVFRRETHRFLRALR